MKKAAYQHTVARDLMVFGLAIEALTLYPHNPLVFAWAVPAGLYSVLRLADRLATSR